MRAAIRARVRGSSVSFLARANSLAASDKPCGALSQGRRWPPPTRRRSTPASAPAEPFSGPRGTRPAVGRRLAMPGHPCTVKAGVMTDTASAPADRQGHHLGRGVDQSDYASPPVFRLVWFVLPLHASVSRRTTPYEFDPQRVTIQPGRRKAANAGQRPLQQCLGTDRREDRIEAEGRSRAARFLGNANGLADGGGLYIGLLVPKGHSQIGGGTLGNKRVPSRVINRVSPWMGAVDCHWGTWLC